MLCHFAHTVAGRPHDIRFESVQVQLSGLVFDSNVRGYVTVDECGGWTPDGLPTRVGRIAFPKGFMRPFVVGRRDRLVASACTSFQGNVVHSVWLAYNKCGAVFLKTTFDHYWSEVQDGAVDRGLILVNRVKEHVWDDYVDVDCVSDALLDVSYLSYRVNFDFFPTRIQFMAERPGGHREYGWIRIAPTSHRRTADNGDVVLDGLHQTSLGPTIEDVVLRRTNEEGDDHAFVVVHYRFDAYVKTAFVHDNDDAYNIYATQAVASPGASFEDLARWVRKLCNERRRTARAAFERRLKHETVENETPVTLPDPGASA